MGFFNKIQEKFGKKKETKDNQEIEKPTKRSESDDKGKVSFEIPEFSEDDLNFDLSLDEFLPEEEQEKVKQISEKEAQEEKDDAKDQSKKESDEKDTTLEKSEENSKEANNKKEDLEHKKSESSQDSKKEDKAQIKAKQVNISTTASETNSNSQKEENSAPQGIEVKDSKKNVKEDNSSKELNDSKTDKNQEYGKASDEQEDNSDEINITISKEDKAQSASLGPGNLTQESKVSKTQDVKEELPVFEDKEEFVLPSFESMSEKSVFVNQNAFKKIINSKNLIMNKIEDKEEHFQNYLDLTQTQEKTYKYVGKEVDGIQHDLMYIDEDIFKEEEEDAKTTIY